MAIHKGGSVDTTLSSKFEEMDTLRRGIEFPKRETHQVAGKALHLNLSSCPTILSPAEGTMQDESHKIVTELAT